MDLHNKTKTLFRTAGRQSMGLPIKTCQILFWKWSWKFCLEKGGESVFSSTMVQAWWHVLGLHFSSNCYSNIWVVGIKITARTSQSTFKPLWSGCPKFGQHGNGVPLTRWSANAYVRSQATSLPARQLQDRPRLLLLHLHCNGATKTPAIVTLIQHIIFPILCRTGSSPDSDSLMSVQPLP